MKTPNTNRLFNSARILGIPIPYSKDEINEATREYLARVAPKAAFSMANVLDDPTELGIKEKMVAAKDLLDRTGHAKTERWK